MKLTESIITGLDKFAYLVYSRLFILIAILLLAFFTAIYFTNETVDCSTDCVGINLMSRNLSGLNLSKANLIEANFQYTNLSEADLRGADLSGANLRGANLQNADLRQTKLIGANLFGADLRNALLDDTDFSGADLSYVDFTRADLTKVVLLGSILEGAKLVEVDLHEADLGGVTLKNADLTGANFDKSRLKGIVFSGANLSGASFIEADLSGSWINLANLTGADFSDSVLAGVSLIGANLTSVNFRGSDIVGANVIGSQLNGANLSGADLSATRLFLAELHPTDFSKDEILLELNELQRTQITKNADLSGVTFDDETIWPIGKSTPLAALLGSRFHITPLGTENTSTLGSDNNNDVINSNKNYFSLPQIDPALVEGDITMAGSTTFASLTESIAGMFATQGYSGTITIDPTSTKSAFQAYCSEESKVDIGQANRWNTSDERTRCLNTRDIPYFIHIGYGALVVIINPTNDFLTDITLEQLPLLLTAERWADINPEWPTSSIKRFLPDSETDTFPIMVDSMFAGDLQPLLNAPGTQFTDKSDIILGVISDVDAIGIVSYPYYKENTQTVKLLTLNEIAPTKETIIDGTYPFSYPLYLYTNKATVTEKPQVSEFLTFYLTHSNIIAEHLGYFPLSNQKLNQQTYRLLNLQGFGTEEN